MIYVLIGIFMLLVFGLCFLVDKLLQRFSKRNRPVSDRQNKVRLARGNIIFGFLLSIVGLAIVLFLAPKRGWILGSMGALILLMGLFLIFNYCLTGIDYDEEGFVYRRPGRKAQRYLYREIRGETAIATRGGINATLYVAEEEVNVYSSMDGTRPFMRAAFNGWCESKGINPDEVSPPNPENLVWFNEPVNEAN